MILQLRSTAIHLTFHILILFQYTILNWFVFLEIMLRAQVDKYVDINTDGLKSCPCFDISGKKIVRNFFVTFPRFLHKIL